MENNHVSFIKQLLRAFLSIIYVLSFSLFWYCLYNNKFNIVFLFSIFIMVLAIVDMIKEVINNKKIAKINSKNKHKKKR